MQQSAARILSLATSNILLSLSKSISFSSVLLVGPPSSFAASSSSSSPFGVRDFERLSFFLPFFADGFRGEDLAELGGAAIATNGSTSSPALTLRSRCFSKRDNIWVSTSARPPLPRPGVPPAVVWRRRLVGRATFPMYLVNFRMTVGLSKGLEQWIDSWENSSGGRSLASASAGSASSASNISSIKAVNFSSGTAHIFGSVNSTGDEITIHLVHLDRLCGGRKT